MSENLKEMARRKVQEAKRKAREERRAAAEALRAKERAKIEAERAEKKAQRDYIKNQENQRKVFAKRVYEEILLPHYKSKKDVLADGKLYIAKMDDGNIYGKNGDEYFFSCQEKNQTYIKVFKDTGIRKVNDGDHYPTFADASTYKVKKIALTPFGRVNPDTVSEEEALSFSFYKDSSMDLFKEVHAIREKADEDIKKLQNTTKR
jgi:hypothetical protein